MAQDGQGKRKILIVDDSEINRAILSDMLETEYDILEAKNGKEALERILELGTELSVLLLDIIMPELDGFGVLEEMGRTRWIEDIPVIMISAASDAESIERAYALGATDFISRPFDPLIVHKRVVNTILLYAKQKQLVGLVAQQVYEKKANRDLMIEVLGHIVEFRNGESGRHIRHVHVLTELILRYLDRKGIASFSAEEIDMIASTSALHDVGKIAIPEQILNKPGRLTPEEFRVIKTHTAIGAKMLRELPMYQDQPLVRTAYEICRWHHERYDGLGYPDGLSGDEIPMSAQVVALADVYDALISPRVYKAAIPHDQAVAMILNGECGTFNPVLMDCLRDMGYGFTDDEKAADVIVINTCAVRGHAEDRVLGNVGALVHTKRQKPGQVICLCGCMMGEPGMVEKVRESYRHVDLCFDTHALWKFPELLQRVIQRRGRVFDTAGGDGSIAEGIPTVRQNALKGWVSVMYGCNNFCSYCIVPYVRGRERSRRPEDILAEVRQMAQAGYKDITLLGQNVNSYGKDLEGDWDFPRLLEEVCAVPGDFLVRFMTSHPKDASQRLFQVMAREPKIAHHLHLPFQCGNDRVLGEMNRGYTAGQYLEKVRLLRQYIPDIVLTSDVIVGFPGETTAEFEDTLRLIEAVRFDALFTFIFSPREGTPAAKMADVLTSEEKQANFQRLVDAQNEISHEIHQSYIGKTFRCLVDGEGTDPRNNLTARTNSGRLVHLSGPHTWIGTFRDITITDATTWALFGRGKEGEA